MNRPLSSRRFRALFAAVALLAAPVLAPCPTALAADPPSANRPIENTLGEGAVQYWQAFGQMPQLDAQQQKLLANWKSIPMDGAVENLVAKSAGAMSQLHRGSACARCDWGLHKEDGFALLLPHLAKARDLGLLTCLRARYRLEHGQSAQAAEDVADVLVLARRVGSDELLIAILVQHAMEQQAMDAIAPHLKALNARTLDALADRLAKLPPGGSLQGSVQVEKQSGLDFLVEAANTAPKDGRTWEQFMEQTARVPAEALRAAGTTPEAIAGRLKEIRPLYDEIPIALKLPHAKAIARLTELRTQAATTPLGKILFPDYARIFERHSAAVARLTMLQAAIAVVRNGPDQVKNFDDPSTGQPFVYVEQPSGFELQSTLTNDGKPVTLTVGPGAK